MLFLYCGATLTTCASRARVLCGVAPWQCLVSAVMQLRASVRVCTCACGRLLQVCGIYLLVISGDIGLLGMFPIK